MKHYNLNIAGYTIRFESAADGPELQPADRFLENIAEGGEPDVEIIVHTGETDIPGSAERVFHAPYFEDVKGVLFRNLENFWSVWKDGDNLYIKTVFPMTSPDTGGVLRFSTRTRRWDLRLEDTGVARDPMEYPLDALVLYYLTVISGDIMIHASGVYSRGKGRIFTGVSGSGKSTMARLWEEEGAFVINDDRIIIRRTNEGYLMHNTPLYVSDPSVAAPLHAIYLIEHGNENRSTVVAGAGAAGLLMANCVQHNWGPEIISGLLLAVTTLVSAVPVIKLSFRPDRSITEHIQNNEG